MSFGRSPWFWASLALVLAAESDAPANDNGRPLALVLAAESDAPANDNGRPLARVALIGDSLAVGLRAPLQKELGPAELRARAAVGAHAGMFTLEGALPAKAFAELLAEFRPELVLVSLGTNDTVPGAGALARALPERFALIRARARAVGARVVFLEPPELPWSRDPIRAAVAHAGGELLRAPAVQQAPDRIHPTAAGYAAWAAHVRKELLR